MASLADPVVRGKSLGGPEAGLKADLEVEQT